MRVSLEEWLGADRMLTTCTASLVNSCMHAAKTEYVPGLVFCARRDTKEGLKLLGGLNYANNGHGKRTR